MTEQEAYQEHIRYTHDTYCRIVIRHASFDAARMLAARRKREISLEYLTEEKLPEQTQEGKNEVFYDCTLCKQILLLLYTKLLLSGIHADRSIHFLTC
jgi:hypothetical protein